MIGTYCAYEYEIDLKQEPAAAWFATIVINRPDGSRLGSYGPLKRQPDLQAIEQEAREFACSQIDQDIRDQASGVSR